jgi:hypothetical protein
LTRLIICAGLLAVPTAQDFAREASQSVRQNDARLVRLREFFEDSPLLGLADEFLVAADREGLDWRLLPSISLVETSRGRTAVGNNVFGWDSGRQRFASVREAIHQVASRLGQSKLYRGKDLNRILTTYNPRPEYALLVKSVMKRLGPAEVVKSRPAIEARLNPVTVSPGITRPEPLQ